MEQQQIEKLLKLNADSLQLQQVTLMTLLHLKDYLMHMHNTYSKTSHANPLLRQAYKCFSQNDEDGITLEILRRMGISDGVYAEFGVGDGLENNTLILAAMGWRGFWVGGEFLKFNYRRASKFSYMRDWVTLDNVLQLLQSGMQSQRCEQLDVISFDLDGNDFYLVERMLQQQVLPKLWIVEYNAKFIPPARFVIEYDPKHQWTNDDYFGAALMNWISLFEQYQYRLVACNPQTGSNAFFVRHDYLSAFADVPTDVMQLYVPPNYHAYNQYGHKPSAKVVETILNR